LRQENKRLQSRLDQALARAQKPKQSASECDWEQRGDDGVLIAAPPPDSLPAGGTVDFFTGEFADDGSPDDDEAAMIRALLKQGFSRNKIAALLGGSRNATLARIRRAAGE
jgi:hypothetical protein